MDIDTKTNIACERKIEPNSEQTASFVVVVSKCSYHDEMCIDKMDDAVLRFSFYGLFHYGSFHLLLIFRLCLFVCVYEICLVG